ncbi:hypothetical protein LTR10_020803 [Elasticomyces elasticus]|uniref:3-carboxymuconate cyclase n=1 Tax=Exophiala sideris TaxID=1016849 RepID=A0ABR0JIF8_9EURO|nr:hypothetical protein LTR10_020803 [Elasticomyces elasticus]KAK5034085.1 hypothetical protein LTS07_003005 [Exophiala sideris]KAK5042381.1 hypothetical protein LTR13_001228 [Exophiala sideris]KAK5065462.1 hypothetical protein LTR69_003011 [Exophiala sideris]KAK5186078.1 hypothetical protein LTR44_002127 [Eurotiomycetes sp. CCFEE 6388]
MLAHIIFTILASSAIIPDVSAAPSPYHGRGTTKSRSSSTSPKAVYLITNDQQNAVAAVPIAADGTLSAGTITLTGGAGSNVIDGATKQPAAPDALDGQSALTIAGQHIFAVNAGSNSLSMFSIDASNPTKLTLLGQPVDLPGEFPNTVAASAKHKIACVGTTGATNGVSCSSFSGSGLGEMDGLRSFDLVQTTPPVGPTNTVSQLFFSEDESRLFATVKGDPTVNNTGFFSVFPVDASSWGKAATVSTTDIRSSPNGTAVLFGSANIPGTSSVFVTDASFGGTVLDVDPATNEASLVAKQVIDGQVATCWATISPLTNSAFVTDAGVNRIVEMSLANASIIAETDLSANGDPGLIDLKAAGDFIYALSPGNGTTPAAITVLDVSGDQGSAKAIQHFALNGMGVDKNAQGMAIP